MEMVWDSLPAATLDLDRFILGSDEAVGSGGLLKTSIGGDQLLVDDFSSPSEAELEGGEGRVGRGLIVTAFAPETFFISLFLDEPPLRGAAAIETFLILVLPLLPPIEY